MLHTFTFINSMPRQGRRGHLTEKTHSEQTEAAGIKKSGRKLLTTGSLAITLKLSDFSKIEKYRRNFTFHNVSLKNLIRKNCLHSFFFILTDLFMKTVDLAD